MTDTVDICRDLWYRIYDEYYREIHNPSMAIAKDTGLLVAGHDMNRKVVKCQVIDNQKYLFFKLKWS